MARASSLAPLYAALVAIRVWSALRGHAYIHPDEFFQSGESAFGDVFGLDTRKMWEFQPSFSCRSMASLRLVNLPASIYAALSPERAPKASTLFYLQRLTFLAASFILDYAVFCLAPRTRRLSALCLLAASSSILTFQVRPFSNSVESTVLALSLLAYRSALEHLSPPAAVVPSSPHLASAALGALAALGLFSRFTFVLFFLPIGVAFLVTLGTSPRSRPSSRLAALLSAAAAFATIAAAHVAYDSRYYARGTRWVLAPFNAFTYNMRTQNVALHGVHPRWLHALVNLPMIVGAAPVATLIWAAVVRCKRRSRSGSVDKRVSDRPAPGVSSAVLSSIIVTSLVGLSISPHQEPRFLLPLVVPTILLFHRHLGSASWRGAARGTKTAILVLFAVQQTLQLFFFGFAHQAGLVPALLHIDRHIVPDLTPLEGRTQTPTKIYFWKTFMVPRHLLPSLSRSDEASTDRRAHIVASNTVTAVELGRAVQEDHEGAATSLSYVVAPTWAFLELAQHLDFARVDIVETFTPHLDMDHIPEMVGAVRKTSPKTGLGLVIATVQP
ncbi:uncharacterized protein PFL1_01457 [Pseudozyma flocculosa PF-1]|uniref:Mannosyltransferase n=1 Tax=Pseudozyma flocculosa TaxID=84751 RepID=A0A5C3EYN0_9BASI|nr:uncharacterized protein PFL1_01457 [Pseudozyma flocculosa PF-1]EPQ31272.1 hypothetical protein PFL1_01457 [Pseudozyma flocculosa PF-1]SPO36229.1 uncharacterized protein PSFLO_01700 [Pseudozyma flocculosa]